MILGHQGLRQLARLKLRGFLRRQARRLRTPSGILFALLGLVLMAAWLVAILLNREVGAGFAPARGPVSVVAVEACLAAFTLMILSSAPNMRGIALAPNELETLFSAPVSRGDLVRHRLQVDLGRSLFGAVVFSVLAVSRLPNPMFGFAGTLLALITLSVLRQLAALALCGVRGRLSVFLGGRAIGLFQAALGIALWLGLMMVLLGDTFLLPEQSPAIRSGLSRILEEPLVVALVAPWRPWAGMMVADTAQEFLTWALPCALFVPVLYEVTARLRVDYREDSIRTAGVIERRLSRLRSSGPLGSGEATSALAARRIPWIFGRGPARAVVWIRCAEIARRARGTLLRSSMVLGLVCVAAGYVAPVEEAGALGGHLIVAWVGVVYLGAGMRFDFRADFDRMERIKAWPVAPARLFCATVLPGVGAMSLLIAAAIGLRVAFVGAGHPALALVLATLPACAVAWVAVDNIVFLYAPVRYVPGQDGALHHVGRAMTLMCVRMALLAVTLALVALASTAVYLAAGAGAGLGEGAARAWAIAAGVVALLCVDAGLVWIGGRSVRRFDVARSLS